MFLNVLISINIAINISINIAIKCLQLAQRLTSLRMTSLRLPLHRGNLLEFAIAFDYAFDLSWLVIQWYE